MVCPVCIAAAITANAPAIAAAAGGFAAARMALGGNQEQRKAVKCQRLAAAEESTPSSAPLARPVVGRRDLPPILSPVTVDAREEKIIMPPTFMPYMHMDD